MANLIGLLTLRTDIQHELGLFTAPPALPGMVRRSGQRRHDRAVPGALYEFRPDARGVAVRKTHRRHRANRVRSFALQSPSPGPGDTRAGRHPRRRRHSASNFRCIPSRKPASGPPPGLDRNLAYLGLVELLYGYPIDGVVLTIGCDKTTPACLMAAATVDIPAIALSVGPMLSAWADGKRIGSGTVVWKARERFAAGEIDRAAFIKLVASAAPSTGYCNTMGTATTMNSLTEVLGMSLPGSAAIPAPLRDRQECAYETGRQIVEMIHADRKPSDILTRESFINAIRVNSALGGSTNAPLHLIALARHIGVELSIDDWQTYGYDIPLLVNLQPAGEYLGEDFYRAGGVPAVVAQLLKQGLLFEKALTANGRTLG